jgi:hypothetical protein
MVHRSLVVLCLAVAVALLAAGCPGQFPKPPFDATGTYLGSWNGNSTDQAQQVIGCPLTLTLTQDVAANYPGDHGDSCIELPECADKPLPSLVNVSGLLADDGKLTLLSGGCGTALCVVLSLTGQGEDGDEDGYMDSYAGTWAFTILLAGVQPFGFTGTFGVDHESQ